MMSSRILYYRISWTSLQVIPYTNVRFFSTSITKSAKALVHGVRGFVNNRPVLASAASETNYNVISEEFARQCRLEIRKSTDSFVVGHGHEISAIGKTNALWRFTGEAMDRETVEFVVLSRCSRPIILGNDFLRHTRTLDINWHRLRLETVEPGLPSVHILGHSQQSIAGSISIKRYPVHALPATGCDVNLISEKYVHSLELSHKINEKRKETIRLVDGSLVKCFGDIRLTWTFGDENFLNSWLKLRFLVLPGCPYDVVLGRDLLFASNAFLRYSDCLRKKTPNSHKFEAGITAMPAIFLAFSRKKGISEAVQATGDSSILQELQRRAAADRQILKMTDSERLPLWKVELERRAKWNEGIKGESGDGDEASSVQSPNLDSRATDMSTYSLAESLQNHSLLAENIAGIGSHFGSDSSDHSDASGDGDGGD